MHPVLLLPGRGPRLPYKKGEKMKRMRVLMQDLTPMSDPKTVSDPEDSVIAIPVQMNIWKQRLQ
jgi:hypothetical protein